MDIQKYFTSVFNRTSVRMKDVQEKVKKELSNKGRFENPDGIKQYMKVGFDVLNNDLTLALDKLSSLTTLNEENWEDIRNLCFNYINEHFQININHDVITKGWGISVIDGLDEFRENLKNEILTAIDLRVAVQKEMVIEKYKQFGRDIIKIILGGVLGALFTYWIKKNTGA